MSFKIKAARIFAMIAIAAGAILAVPQAASAANEAVDMNLVCQQNYGNTSYGAFVNNSNSVYGWKCWNRAYPEQRVLGPWFDADVNYYCMVVYGRYSYSNAAYFTNASSPYSWRCR